MIFLTHYALFLFKILTSFLLLFILIAAIFKLIAKRKSSPKLLQIKKLNQHYQALANSLNQAILSKKEYKQYQKAQKKNLQSEKNKKNIIVLDFLGDLKASSIADLRETITAILQMNTPVDEVIVRLESPGGLVPHYGLAASQLARLRDQNIRLVVSIDKMAASGGYLMACVANEIIAAPFAVIGSIGVVTQFPNFHRLLKENYIDFELLCAGDTKRTLTMFGENTPEDRAKMQNQLNNVHTAFKNFVAQYREQVNLPEVANGDHWLASQAVELKLIDRLMTSDDYLLQASMQASIYHLSYPQPKPSLREKMGVALTAFSRDNWYSSYVERLFFK